MSGVTQRSGEKFPTSTRRHQLAPNISNPMIRCILSPKSEQMHATLFSIEMGNLDKSGIVVSVLNLLEMHSRSAASIDHFHLDFDVLRSFRIYVVHDRVVSN